MYLKPMVSTFDLDKYQYVLIDQAIVGKLDGFDASFDDAKISLASKADILNVDHYPVLIDLSKLDDQLHQELFTRHQTYIDYYQQPLITFALNLRDMQSLGKNFDLESFFDGLLYYQKSEKTYLRRFYDPKIILQLNHYQDEVDLLSEIFYPIQALSVYFEKHWYHFELSDFSHKEHADINYKNIDLSALSYANRLVNKLNIENLDLGLFLLICKSVYKNLAKIRHDHGSNLSAVDTLSLLFHMQLLGAHYLDLDHTLKLLSHSDGYDQASKAIDDEQWNQLFKHFNILYNKELIQKVKYGY